MSEQDKQIARPVGAPAPPSGDSSIQPAGSLTQPADPPTSTPSSLKLTASRTETYSGPLPHPQLLAHYERLVPGSAERMLARFEKQSDHRMYLEKKVIDSDARRADCGVGAGLIVTLA